MNSDSTQRSDRCTRIAVLPGDGIGPEVTSAAVTILSALESRVDGLVFEFEELSVGAGEYLKNGDPLPGAAFEACQRADASLLGAMGLPDVRWPDGKEMTPQIDLRERLDLYAGIRPIRLFHSEDSPLKQGAGTLDFVIVRENCEGLFSARLSQFDGAGTEVRDVLRITRSGSERICRAAFELARKRNGKLTLVDKANVLPSMVFLRNIFKEISDEYPDIETECVYVDAMALYMVQRPETFDVLVTENMFGDILSDLAAGLIGGMGMAPSGDIGSTCAVFQPSHGTAPDIAGRGVANPVASVLSAAMMLEWLGRPETLQGAERIQSAVQMAMADPGMRTPDVGGSRTTEEITNAILDNL